MASFDPRRRSAGRIESPRERDDAVVVPVESTSKRRPVIALIAGALLLVGGAFWVLSGNDSTSTSTALAPGASIAITSVPATSAAVTTVPTTTGSAITTLMSTSASSMPASTAAPTVVATQAPRRPDFNQAYSAAGCSNGATFAQCLKTLTGYCTSFPPAVWHVPNVVGRNLAHYITPEELDHARWFSWCSWQSAWPEIPNVIATQCTADPSLEGVIISQGWVAGSTIHYPTLPQFNLTVWAYCAGSTTSSPTSTLPPVTPPTTAPPAPPAP